MPSIPDSITGSSSPVETNRSAAQRWAGPVKIVSLVLILASLLVIVRMLPVDRAIEALKNYVNHLGLLGPVVMGIAYVLAALLFVPGSALTLASGAIFGLVVGTITVSLSSTAAAALAFLIARYFARKKVATQARKYPKFKAIDKAIGDGGWKIIAMLRLSPAIPFSLGNYMYGLTAIRFWPYVLASWVFMLPGTFLYVYLAHVSAEGLAAASGDTGGRSMGEWMLLVVGLLATVGVSVYVTQIARKAIKEQTQIDQVESTMQEDVQEDAGVTPQGAGQRPAKGWPWSATMAACCAVLTLGLAASSYAYRGVLSGLFGPPAVILHEAYQVEPTAPKFDHTLFDELLKAHVDQDGWVDYAGLKKEEAKLDRYLAQVAQAPFDAFDRNGKLAFLINAYNAFTLRLILDHYPIGSIQDIPQEHRWDAARWHIASHTWSLNQIEHEQIRPKFSEPRVHFALVCAAVGCPKLRNEAYQADRIEQQLEDQARYIHSHDRWFHLDEDKSEVYLTSLYQWYSGDFEQKAGSVLNFAARYSPPLKAMLDAGRTPLVTYLPYDWSLNDKSNAK